MKCACLYAADSQLFHNENVKVNLKIITSWCGYFCQSNIRSYIVCSRTSQESITKRLGKQLLHYNVSVFIDLSVLSAMHGIVNCIAVEQKTTGSSKALP